MNITGNGNQKNFSRHDVQELKATFHVPVFYSDSTVADFWLL